MFFCEDVVLPSRKAHFINGAQDLGDDYNNGCYCRTLIGNINAGTLVIGPSAEEDAASAPRLGNTVLEVNINTEDKGELFFHPGTKAWTLIAAMKHPRAVIKRSRVHTTLSGHDN